MLGIIAVIVLIYTIAAENYKDIMVPLSFYCFLEKFNNCHVFFVFDHWTRNYFFFLSLYLRKLQTCNYNIINILISF